MRRDNMLIERRSDSRRKAAMDSSDRVWRERGLKAAVLAGDEAAWRAWYDESFDRLYAYARWCCGGNRDRADDVVQETWLTAVRRIGEFDPDRGSFIGWLRGIAANVLRNQLRSDALRNGRRESLHESAVVRDEPDDDAADDRSTRIAAAFTALAPRYEAVLRAKYLDEQSVAEIAAAWNETPKAIESLLTRARQAFRDAFQDLE